MGGYTELVGYRVVEAACEEEVLYSIKNYCAQIYIRLRK